MLIIKLYIFHFFSFGEGLVTLSETLHLKIIFNFKKTPLNIDQTLS